jgi:hypothetical protein
MEVDGFIENFGLKMSNKVLQQFLTAEEFGWDTEYNRF